MHHITLFYKRDTLFGIEDDIGYIKATWLNLRDSKFCYKLMFLLILKLICVHLLNLKAYIKIYEAMSRWVYKLLLYKSYIFWEK